MNRKQYPDPALAGRVGGRSDARGAKVRVLHAFQPPNVAFPAEVAQSLGWPARPDEFFREKAGADLARFVEETEWHDVSHDAEFVTGDPESIILD